jgi:hypothetical protein
VQREHPSKRERVLLLCHAEPARWIKKALKKKTEMKSSPPFSVGAVFGDCGGVNIKRQWDTAHASGGIFFLKKRERKKSPKKSRLKHRLDISAPPTNKEHSKQRASGGPNNASR